MKTFKFKIEDYINAQQNFVKSICALIAIAHFDSTRHIDRQIALYSNSKVRF